MVRQEGTVRETEMDYFSNRINSLFDNWKNRIEKITLDSRLATGPQSTPSNFTIPLPNSLRSEERV